MAGALDLGTHLGPLAFENPILTASGTFGYGLEFGHLTPLDRLGGLVTKGLSREPILGNPPERIWETRGGMLNSIGLQNIGIEAFLGDVLPGLARYPARVIVNLFGYRLEDYVWLAERVDGETGVAAIELNVSCPNVKRGGVQFGHDPAVLAELVGSVRRATSKPLGVKLSPNVTDVTLLARAAVDAGADFLSAVNTFVGMAIDIHRRRPRLATVKGGLSGPAIKPLALRVVWEVARAVDCPVIGIGGIETADDVVEYLLAGASAVQVGTALFRDPQTPVRILEGLELYLQRHGVDRLEDLVGALEIDE